MTPSTLNRALASQVFLPHGRPRITFSVDLQECIIEETSLGAAGKNPFSSQQWFPINGLPVYQAAAGNVLLLCFARNNAFQTKSRTLAEKARTHVAREDTTTTGK